MTSKPKNLARMAGNDAWDAYYRDKLLELYGADAIAEHQTRQAFYAGIDHAIEYVREAQGETYDA